MMKTPIVVLFALLANVVSAGTNAAGLAFLEENKSKEGVVTLPSGLQYKVLREGTGAAHPKVHTPCYCHYEGTLIDGTKFDSSYDRGEPTSFAPSQVIKGWTEAMQLMVEGDKWEMYIPSELGYGDTGSPPKIKGGDVLIFVMEIIEIDGESVPAVKCDPVTKKLCDEKELAYIEKIEKKHEGSKEKLKAEADRLTKMTGSKMKPELQVWLTRRLSILTKLVGDEL
eukprot:CAMPEP_0195330320 /NCGR_PEP_ID=MMETSP0708-20121125/11973_1 /TAXON_ID=33640 /ORGANISM="Asterionellopsis glacialis, Strain CCMP134" /LENGTH=225 /DNA_ID=CAMNT_0040398587 /DNA_START=59 /DNA_END=736 /DNA_ORIENTATION=+